MKKIEIVKENHMQYAILIDGKIHTRCGAYCTAKKIKRNLDFVFNIGR